MNKAGWRRSRAVREVDRQREIRDRAPASVVLTAPEPDTSAQTAAEKEPRWVTLAVVVAAGLGGLLYHAHHVHHSAWGYVSAVVAGASIADAARRLKRRCSPGPLLTETRSRAREGTHLRRQSQEVDWHADLAARTTFSTHGEASEAGRRTVRRVAWAVFGVVWLVVFVGAEFWHYASRHRHDTVIALIVGIRHPCRRPSPRGRWSAVPLAKVESAALGF